MSDRPTHAEQQMLSALATVTDEVRNLKREVTDLRGEVRKTKEIVEAWGAMKTIGKFITWVGVIVGSLTAIAVGVKLGVQHIMGGKLP